MSAFTPGPWRWDADEQQIRAGENVIVETDSGYYPPHGADRALIASAPDLLAALVALHRESLPYADGRPSEKLGEARTAALIAIRKATTP